MDRIEGWLVGRSVLRRMLIVISLATLALAACGSDSPPEATGPAAGGSSSAGPVSNACPADGCAIDIVSVESAGDEISVTWEANFIPDVSRNHIHIYWDIYTSDQVSSDAESRGLTQGEWVPTDAYPTYVTEGAVSVKNRGDSTVVCVTAGDRDHVVIDPSIVDCQDVSDLL